MSDSEGPLKTNFLANQAKDISTPAYKKFPVILLLIIFAAAVVFGIWQLVSLTISYPKLVAAKNVQINLESAKMEGGYAFVDLEVVNDNDAVLTKMNVKYDIYGGNGDTIGEGNLPIEKSVPAGGKMLIKHVKLGALTENAGKMHAEVTEATLAR